MNAGVLNSTWTLETACNSLDFPRIQATMIEFIRTKIVDETKEVVGTIGC